MNETSGAEPLEANTAGQLRGRQWGTVYTGPDVKCYRIKFSSLNDPLHKDRDPGIGVYVDGDQAGNQVATLTVGRSTEVCGRKIYVYGLLSEAQVAFWEATEAQETAWVQ